MVLKNLDSSLNILYQCTCIGVIVFGLIIGGLTFLDVLQTETAVPLIIFAIIEFALTLGVRFYQADVKKSTSDRRRIFYNWLGLTVFLAALAIIIGLL
ncbi:MAG: hypothetical protein OdinLCB4_004870 [Candidatus Odinarchaeum yellowstonii]|uniref:Uncharacterized protein n=1 Tax=Odinarchaeota yellowstonii (strain LCB_4) TaxID=1841599 RepID=A0AAF0D158_ODILC|nr:MAG: hypothetical protein OdinLCB4_004870 [Candidatus Odinarchaeum yellowstonii]